MARKKKAKANGASPEAPPTQTQTQQTPPPGVPPVPPTGTANCCDSDDGQDAFVDWRPAPRSNFSQADVEKIGPELVQMRAEGLPVTVSTVIKRAEDVDNVLHPYLFEVPPERMEHEWRRMRAGQMIRCVKIIYTFRNPAGRPCSGEVRAFHRVEKIIPVASTEYEDQQTEEEMTGEHVGTSSGGYVTFTEVVDTPEYLAQVIAQKRASLEREVRSCRFYVNRVPGFATNYAAVLAEMRLILDAMAAAGAGS
jgi:hypothetical protein